MEASKQERIKISSELLDAMLVGVKTKDDLWGKDGIITKLNKALLERMFDAEMDFYLEDQLFGRKVGNSRNGHGKKTVWSSAGEIQIQTPRDRQSTFELQIITKRTTRLENFNRLFSLFTLKA